MDPVILHVCDDEGDSLLLRLAFRRAGLRVKIVDVCGGKEAIHYLTSSSDRAAHPLPALLLLDLKISRMDNRDVLAALYKRPEFKELPVVVMSASEDPLDLARALDLGARDYLVKPRGLDGLVEVVKKNIAIWLTTPGERASQELP